LDIFSNIVRVAKVTVDEINKPESYVKGEDFERYVSTKLFPAEKYELLHQTHNYTTNKERYVDESKEPDFKFRSKINNKEFYVEAKYRKYYHENAIPWCNEYQLKRYQTIDKDIPVFIVLAVGGEPSSPDELFLIPMRNIKYTTLFRSFLTKYSSNLGQPVDYRVLGLK